MRAWFSNGTVETIVDSNNKSTALTFRFLLSLANRHDCLAVLWANVCEHRKSFAIFQLLFSTFKSFGANYCHFLILCETIINAHEVVIEHSLISRCWSHHSVIVSAYWANIPFFRMIDQIKWSLVTVPPHNLFHAELAVSVFKKKRKMIGKWTTDISVLLRIVIASTTYRTDVPIFWGYVCPKL